MLQSPDYPIDAERMQLAQELAKLSANKDLIAESIVATRSMQEHYLQDALTELAASDMPEELKSRATAQIEWISQKLTDLTSQLINEMEGDLQDFVTKALYEVCTKEVLIATLAFARTPEGHAWFQGQVRYLKHIEPLMLHTLRRVQEEMEKLMNESLPPELQ